MAPAAAVVRQPLICCNLFIRRIHDSHRLRRGRCIGEKTGAGNADWVQAQQHGQAVRTASGFAAGAALAKKRGWRRGLGPGAATRTGGKNSAWLRRGRLHWKKNGAENADWVQAQQHGQAVRTAPGFAAGGCIGKKTGLKTRIGSRLSNTDRR